MCIVFEKINEDHFEGLISLFEEFALFEKLPEKMVNTVEQMREEKAFINGFVAKDPQNHIIGYVTFFFAYYTWSGKALYMDDLYVKDSYRGKGLGTALIRKAIEFAESNDCYKLRWQVSEWNHNAIKFYKSLGALIDHVEMNCDLLLKS